MPTIKLWLWAKRRCAILPLPVNVCAQKVIKAASAGSYEGNGKFSLPTWTMAPLYLNVLSFQI